MKKPCACSIEKTQILAQVSIVAWALYNGPAMKILCLACLCAALALAAEMSNGYFRGKMVSFDGSPTKGVLSARGADGNVSTCGFDSKSYLEFEKRRVTVDQLREGDPLEVLVYRHAGETACYILSLQVVPPPPVVRPNRRVDVTPVKPIRPVPVRHGNQNVAGVVVQVSDGSVTLRTRTGEEETFLLRTDTRYMGNGLKMERRDVTVNQRLSVEASRNLEGQMEAFQLTWGDLSAR